MQSICRLLPVMILAFGCTAAPDTANPDPAAPDQGTSARQQPPDPKCVAIDVDGIAICQPCVSASNGLYCGNSTQGGFRGDSRVGQYLFTCIGGGPADFTKCQTSCTIEPAGTPDQCKPDPCAATTSNGQFCGRTTQLGFNPQNASNFAVYTCTSRKTTSIQFCTNGCVIAPSGTPDHCS